MLQNYVRYTIPSAPILKWLTSAGDGVAEPINAILIGQLLSSPAAVIAAAVVNILVDCLAFHLSGAMVFPALILVEVLLIAARSATYRALSRTARRRAATPTERALILSLLWCATVGATAFAELASGLPTLQVFAAMMVLSIIGPLCARSYSAPRFALLQIFLIKAPFVAGACVSGLPWLLILVPLEPAFLYGMWRVVCQLQKMAISMLVAERESQFRALHDPLTGLLNRRGYSEALLAATFADQQRFSLMCLDLDGFKRINDTMGHPAGDALLQGVARRLEATVRERDQVIRLGGDEFVILAPDLPSEAVGQFADRIISCVSDEPYAFDDLAPIRIGVSIGYACAPEDGSTAEELRRKADIALYASKAAGKGVKRRFELQLVS